MLGRRRQLPIPRFLPELCSNCGRELKWTVVSHYDPIIRKHKADYYTAECVCGEVYYRDPRGQPVEPATENFAPDRSMFAKSPQGNQWYPGTTEYSEGERKAAEAAKQAAIAAAQKAAAAKEAAAQQAAQQPAAEGGAPPVPAPAAAPAAGAPVPSADAGAPPAETPAVD
jgi:hypothetical protein